MTYNHPEPDNELLEQFNEAGEVIEPITRAEVKMCAEKPWLGVVNVFIVNSVGKFLATKRSTILSGNPGKWQTYCGGHLKSEQDWSEACISELNEEIGLTIDQKNIHLIAEGKDEKWRKFFKTYVYFWNGAISDLVFNDGEITEARWMSFEDYRNEQSAQPESWCNNCKPEREEQIKKLLAESH